MPARRAAAVVLPPLVLLACGPRPGPEAAEPASSPPPAREVRLVMGTTAEVRVGGLGDATPALDAAFAALAGVEDRLSLWTASELADLNATREATVSPETLEVLAHALEVAEASGGAFDPTVEPLVRAAGGFGGTPRTLDPATLPELLGRVGHRHVRVDAEARRVRLEAGARLVLDGIAKGDGADRALEALRAAGAASGVVDLGGSTLAVFGETLTVDLRDPSGEGRPWGAFRLENAGLGTSGGDQRPGHILDPRTGRPATGVLQASVLAATAREADALSTALYVLGADAGLALVDRRGAAGLVLLEVEGRRVLRTTPGFAASHALVVAPGVAHEGESAPEVVR